MAITKLSKPGLKQVEAEVLGQDGLPVVSEFDFGEPEILTVQVSDAVSLSFREPRADDAIKLREYETKNKNISDIESTLFTICLLHYPQEGQGRLTIKDAKRLSTKQLKKIGSVLNQLMAGDQEGEDDGDELDNKS
jgi:hypothetical protein